MFIPKKWTLSSHKNLHRMFISARFSAANNLMPKGKMDKQIVIRLKSGLLIHRRKEWTSDAGNNTDKRQRPYAKGKTQGVTYRMSPFKWPSEKAKLQWQKADQWLPGPRHGEGPTAKGHEGIFWNSCFISWAQGCLYDCTHLSKLISLYTSK